MNSVFRNFLIFCLFFVVPVAGQAAQKLTSNAVVNVTSDTAANAKNMAFKEARRQIATDVISKYADAETFKELIGRATDDDLTNLIASSTIDGEQLSATTYSANIKMTIDVIAAQKWLNDNNVQNWLGGASSADTLMLVVDLSNGLTDWIEINQAARRENTDLNIQRISGSQVFAEIPVSSRAMLTIALREAGWKYSDDNGVLRIRK